ncbi:MAG: type II toxin-antitoxin system RelE/ParE family toxin [Pseudomonadota bacterium]
MRRGGEGHVASVVFCALKDDMTLLNGFVKKIQKTPDKKLDTATKRMTGFDLLP